MKEIWQIQLGFLIEKCKNFFENKGDKIEHMEK